jgi:hypothetical protein
MKTKMNRMRNIRAGQQSKTRKNHSQNKYSEQHMIVMFLRMLNTVKLFHWKTSNYAQHKATDELYTNLNLSIDTFVEIFLGKTGSRVNLTGTKSLPLLDFTDVNHFKKEIEMYKKYLIDMSHHSMLNEKQDTDLINVRDEILGHLNQFTYLLTFK